MGKYYGVVWSYEDQNSLSHYGIIGQKWGIRRFQNLDRSLTPEGKERYYKKSSSEFANKKTIKTAAKDYVDFTYGKVKDEKRASEAANLGLLALAKMGREIPTDATDEDQKDWFLYEDQTVGLPVIADLVNKGYSAKEIGDLIDDVNKHDSDFYENRQEEDLAFNLRENIYDDAGKKFAKACEEVKNGKLKELEYFSLPHGQERDDKLERVLKSFHDSQDDSRYTEMLVDRLKSTHGSGVLHDDIKTTDGKKAFDAFKSADKEQSKTFRDILARKNPNLVEKYEKEPWTFSDMQERYQKNNPEYRKAVEKTNSAWEKYCEQVLKDMDMPINKNTIQYIENLLLWLE